MIEAALGIAILDMVLIFSIAWTSSEAIGELRERIEKLEGK